MSFFHLVASSFATAHRTDGLFWLSGASTRCVDQKEKFAAEDRNDTLIFQIFARARGADICAMCISIVWRDNTAIIYVEQSGKTSRKIKKKRANEQSEEIISLFASIICGT